VGSFHSEDQIDTDPLPPGQVWGISPESIGGALKLYAEAVDPAAIREIYLLFKYLTKYISYCIMSIIIFNTDFINVTWVKHIHMKERRINKGVIPKSKIDDFCRRWHITQLGLFGSFLGNDFSRESDIDILVSFTPDSPWSLFDLVDMQDELAEIFGRKVDLVEREALRNPFRLRDILKNLELIYET